jgi:hypothetical protein
VVNWAVVREVPRLIAYEAIPFIRIVIRAISGRVPRLFTPETVAPDLGSVFGAILGVMAFFFTIITDAPCNCWS